MVLYHGTNHTSAVSIVNKGIDLACSQKYLDFGPGFYATSSYYHAAITAIRKTDKYNRINKLNENPYIVKVNYIPSEGLNIAYYKNPDERWKMFCISNRLKDDILKFYHIDEHNQDCRYDVCYGLIADGEIISIASEINQKTLSPYNITCDMIMKNKKENIQNQYSFHTPKALSCIAVDSYETIRNESRYRRCIKRR